MEDNLINCIFEQKCGDSVLVVEKTSQKGKDGSFLYKCCFQKYPCEILVAKCQILRRSVINPQIEQKEFLDKIWPQNCGDSLKIIEKIVRKGKVTLFKCEFIKYPFEIYTYKDSILKGQVQNPNIEQFEFIGKEFKQNCGDSLKVIEKTNNKSGNNFYYKCKFLKYPNCEILALKSAILKGSVENINIIWKSKEKLENYIKNNFSEKVTLTKLADNFGIALSTIGQKINEFGLEKYISYSYDNQEIILKKYLKQFNIKAVSKHFSKEFDFKELDIYIYEKNLGIEYNGNYWHSELYKKQNYHQDKSLLFLNKGIKIFHIFEYEWFINQKILKDLIKSKLGIFDQKIFARKCIIKEINNKEYQNFCNQNHLQGEAGAKIKLGLFYKNELVQIMSFGAPRFTDKFDWEIIRECSKLGYCIIGGKERLWKYFINRCNPSNCISYCDFSKFTGESYLKLGFKKERLNKPGFVWWNKNNNKVFWRNPYKHQEMKEKYLKIWDCGQLVFIWEK